LYRCRCVSSAPALPERKRRPCGPAASRRAAFRGTPRLQGGQDRPARQGNADGHRQPLAGELVHDVQQAQLAPRQQAVLLEVVAPDMVWPLCLARNTAARLWPALHRARRHLKAAPAPDALHALVVNGLTARPQQSMSAADVRARRCALLAGPGEVLPKPSPKPNRMGWSSCWAS